MEAAGGWLPAVAPATRISSRGAAAESANCKAPRNVLKVRLTGSECPLSSSDVFQRRLRLATAVQCSTADRPAESQHEVGKKRGKGRPKKLKVTEEDNDASQRLESSLEVSTSAPEVAKETGSKKVVAKREKDGVEGEKAAEVNHGYFVSEKESTPVPKDKASDAKREERGGGSGDKAREWKSEEPEPTSSRVTDEELHARIEKEIERVRGITGDDGDDYPLFMEEDDPTWPEEADTGWGFRLSEFFDDKKMKVTNDKSDEGNNDEGNKDDDDDELAINWDQDYEKGMIVDITQNEWTATVFANLSPVVVYVYERYGPRAQVGWDMLREVEKTVEEIWKKVPVRAVKVDAGVEVDLAAAMKVEKTPVVLLVKAGKILHAVEGFTASKELSQIAAHFFYGAKRPKCLDKVASPPKTLEVS